jgi:ABC-2 type transport system ATP-binding protein
VGIVISKVTMSQQADFILETDGLTKHYGALPALEGLAVSVRPGPVGLLGPNGAGKTTLIKLLLGLIAPTSGNARVLGMNTVANPLDIRRRIGYVPESDCFIPNINAVTYVAFAGRLVGMGGKDAMERAHSVLSYTGLEEARYRNVDTYSTGMKQRLKVAQALVHHPSLLFLDEPTSGLDPQGREEMLTLIEDIAKNVGISTIFSTHILPDVERVCRDVLVLNRGRLVKYGALSDLKQQADMAFDVTVKGNVEGFLAQLGKAGHAWKKTEEGFLRITVRDEKDTGGIVSAAAASGAQLRHMVRSTSSLEELFTELVDAEVVE